MSITSKVRAIMLLREKTVRDMGALIGVEEQSFRNKLARQSFTVDDLVKIAGALDAKLYMELGRNQRILFEMSDLPDKPNRRSKQYKAMLQQTAGEDPEE